MMAGTSIQGECLVTNHSKDKRMYINGCAEEIIRYITTKTVCTPISAAHAFEVQTNHKLPVIRLEMCV